MGEEMDERADWGTWCGRGAAVTICEAGSTVDASVGVMEVAGVGVEVVGDE